MRTAPIVCPEESPFGAPVGAVPLSRWGLTRRLRRGWWGCRPGGKYFFLSKRKKVPKKARGTATPEAAHVAMHTATKPCAWAWLRASWLSAISGASRPSASPWWRASVCGSRTVGCPEFIRGIQFRPLGRNSLTTFRGQTALRAVSTSARCAHPPGKAFIAHF